MKLADWHILKRSLDSKKAMYFCISIAVLNKSLIALIYSSLKDDKALYLLFAKSFLEIGKLVVPVIPVENGIPIYLYDPAVQSPFYSLLAATFLWLTGSYFITQYILSFISCLIFCTAAWHIAKLVFQQQWLANLFVLCVGFFLYPHELSSTPKDNFAVGFTLWGIVLIHRFLSNTPRATITCLLAAIFGCLAMVKLLYVPLVVVLVFLLFVFVFLNKSKAHLLHVLMLCGLLAVLFVSIQYLIFKPAYQIGSSQPVRVASNGIMSVGSDIKNTRHFFPFISSSLINTELWAVQAEKFAAIPFPKSIEGFRFIDLTLLLPLVFIVLFFSRKIISHKVLFSLVGVSICMVSVVFSLSLSGKGVTYKSSEASWTFVMDARSFLLPMITLQLALFLFIFRYSKFSWARKALLFLFLFECGHGLYFTFKSVIKTEKIAEANVQNDASKQVTDLVKKQSNHQPISLVTADHLLMRYAQVQNLKTFAFTNLPANLSWIKKGERFLIVTYAEDTAYLKKFPTPLIAGDTIPPFILHWYTAK